MMPHGNTGRHLIKNGNKPIKGLHYFTRPLEQGEICAFEFYANYVVVETTNKKRHSPQIKQGNKHLMDEYTTVLDAFDWMCVIEEQGRSTTHMHIIVVYNMGPNLTPVGFGSMCRVENFKPSLPRLMVNPNIGFNTTRVNPYQSCQVVGGLELTCNQKGNMVFHGGTGQYVTKHGTEDRQANNKLVKVKLVKSQAILIRLAPTNFDARARAIRATMDEDEFKALWPVSDNINSAVITSWTGYRHSGTSHEQLRLHKWAPPTPLLTIETEDAFEDWQTIEYPEDPTIVST
jgi:hypothetical protein